MKTKRKVAGKDWEFDGSTINVHIPMTWRRHGSRKVIVAPEAMPGRQRTGDRTKR
jgi:hypothetical protein